MTPRVARRGGGKFYDIYNLRVNHYTISQKKQPPSPCSKKGDFMPNNSDNKTRKLEETLLKYKRVTKGEHKYSELCEMLREKELPHGTQKRKTQLKHWKQYMDIEYLPKTDSSSQYYERMCYILFIYLYQKYEIYKDADPKNNVSVEVTLTGSELYKLFGLVNDKWGVLYEDHEETPLKTKIVDRYPNTYSQFVSMVATFSKTIFDNCLKSLRDKRLINYYTKYQVRTIDGEIITLNEKQADLLTKVERKVLDDMYDDIWDWKEGTWKEKSKFGMQDVCARNQLENFRSKVCFYWELENKEDGGGFPIKWYRCVYTIHAIKGYFERYIKEVIRNDIEYAEWCLAKYKQEINDLAVERLADKKKQQAVDKFAESIPIVEAAKDRGDIFAPTKNIRIYNELLSHYHLIKFGEFVEFKKYEKFPNKETAIKTYKDIYNKMLAETVKRL